MATLNVTFAFLTTVESFTANPGSTDTTMQWQTADGNPSGCLETVTSTRKQDDDNTWTRSLTWEAMGVPSGSTITGVTSASMDWRCSAVNVPNTHSHDGATLVDGATTITLSNAAIPISTTSAWAAATGTDSTGLSLASSYSVDITILNHILTGNNAAASTTIRQDQLAFTITYTPADVIWDASGDVDGQQATITSGDADFIEANTYNASGNVTAQQAAASGTADFIEADTYNASGNVSAQQATITSGDANFVEANTYDASGDVAGQQATASGSAFFDDGIWDASGSVQAQQATVSGAADLAFEIKGATGGGLGEEVPDDLQTLDTTDTGTINPDFTWETFGWEISTKGQADQNNAITALRTKEQAVVGERFVISWTYSGSDLFGIAFAGTTIDSSYYTAGDHNFIGTAANNITIISFLGNATTDGVISNVSIEQLADNVAQATVVGTAFFNDGIWDASGSVQAQQAIASGDADLAFEVHVASGSVQAQQATATGTANWVAANTYDASGDVDGQQATASGDADLTYEVHSASGSVQAQQATVSGDADFIVPGTFNASGNVTAQQATASGTANFIEADTHDASGDVTAQQVTASGDADLIIPGVFTASGDVQAQQAEASGAADWIEADTFDASGTVQAQQATATATATILTGTFPASGDVQAQQATASGTGAKLEAETYDASGNAQAQQAAVSGTGAAILLGNFPASGDVQAKQATASGTAAKIDAATHVASGNVQAQQANVVSLARWKSIINFEDFHEDNIIVVRKDDRDINIELDDREINILSTDKIINVR